MSSDLMVYGITGDGDQILLGSIKNHPGAKREEITRNYFGQPTDDKDAFSDPNMCLMALEEYHYWLVEQGWTGPKLEVTPVKEEDDGNATGS